MTIEKKDKTKNAFPDRANLLPEQSQRLESWVEQVNKNTQGALKISKSDLVNYFLEEREDQLSEEDQIRLEMKFHNESKWTSWALSQIKARAKEGLHLTLEELIKAKNDRWGKVKKNSAARKSKIQNIEAHE